MEGLGGSSRDVAGRPGGRTQKMTVKNAKTLFFDHKNIVKYYGFSNFRESNAEARKAFKLRVFWTPKGTFWKVFASKTQ